MNCKQSEGIVARDDNSNSAVAFAGRPPGGGRSQSTDTDTEATQAGTAPGVEGPGSDSHATDDRFCSSHMCIENFSNGNGYIVQCSDGDWSHSGGLSGACSDHGGES